MYSIYSKYQIWSQANRWYHCSNPGRILFQTDFPLLVATSTDPVHPLVAPDLYYFPVVIIPGRIILRWPNRFKLCSVLSDTVSFIFILTPQFLPFCSLDTLSVFLAKNIFSYVLCSLSPLQSWNTGLIQPMFYRYGSMFFYKYFYHIILCLRLPTFFVFVCSIRVFTLS